MLLNVRALAVAGAVLAGALSLIVGTWHLVFPPYGGALLELLASIYSVVGYDGPGGFGSVLLLTLYTMIDGAIGGAVLAWLYNSVARRGMAE
jgi:hypothetical protein